MRPLDVAVCGCGPAGLAAALYLERLGHRIVLVERFKEPRPLGSGLLLQPVGLEVLADLGLAEEIKVLGRPITRLFGKSVPSGRTVLDVRYGALEPSAFSLGIHRAALFGTLFQACCGRHISLETGFEVASIDYAGSGRPVIQSTYGRKLGPFDLAIDSLGSRSAITEYAFGPRVHRSLSYGALWCSLPWPGAPFDPTALEQRYRDASRMAGVLPTGRRTLDGSEEAALFWSLKAKDQEAWRERALVAWKDEAAKLWPELANMLTGIADASQLVFASYGHHTLALPIASGLAVIGDAAHAASPQLGQGANMALLDARALALAISGETNLSDALAAYAQYRRWHVRLYQAMSFVFTPFYQSDGRALPFLRDHLFSLVERGPGGRRLLASLVAGRWFGSYRAVVRDVTHRAPG
jgi:2-polyprenyl-6-methoxyphenol hydroxylase-like FAD-dependent oxidoreductase